MHKIFLLVFAILLAKPGKAQSLEQFMSHPIEQSLAASSDGKNLAWVINDRGKRNIIVKLGNEPPKLFTDFGADDGQELSQLTFSPNGTKLLFVRGGSANKNGESPNPASLPQGAEQAIYFKDITSKYPATRIAQGSSPVFFKDGLKFLMEKGGQIYECTPDVNATPKLLFSARGVNSKPVFSPSGNEVAFVSTRGDHSFIGIYSFVTNAIRWMAPDINHDSFPAWSPDGRQIAFVRIPGNRVGSLNNIMGGNFFGIAIGDVETLRAKMVWTSPADDGGFSQYYPSPVLSWTSTGRILFFSEHTGWNHVFSMNADGSDLKDITSGDGEVENYSLDTQHQHIYFDGNREDVNRRHIWKSNITTGVVSAVTAGEGIETSPRMVGNLVYCFSGSYNSGRKLVRVGANSALEAMWVQKPSTFLASGFVKPEAVTFKSADGTLVHGQLFINRANADRRPGIVFMHGGPIRQMLLGFHYSDYYIHCYAFNQYLACQGYAVLSVNFRAGTGYGKDFRRAANQGPRGASEYQDIVAGAKFLQSLKEVAPEKIGLWGGSYGGYLTAMGLARSPEIFKAGVDVHGVHDWAFRAREFSPGGGWGITSAEMDVAYKSSPISDLSKWTAPVLLVHGDDDRNVLFQQTTDLGEKLRERKVPVETLILPDEVHGFLRYESWFRVFSAAKDFFDRKLK